MNLYHDQAETWKDIPGFEGYYQASTHGHIRSSKREITQKGPKGDYTRIMKGKIIRPRKQNSNYYIVWLSVRGRIFAELVHRLVAKTFILNPDGKPCINHKNGNKEDNHIDNLEWCDYSENIKHSHEVLGIKGTIRPIFCVELNRKFKTQADAARELGLNKSALSNALRTSARVGGYTWKYM